MRFLFQDCVLDTARRELHCGGELQAVEPQVFDLLTFLLHNRHRVVSRDDLIEHIWNGRIVSESTLATRIGAARRAIGDDGKKQRLIRTVSRKGIRFVAEAREEGKAVTPPPAFAGSAPAPKQEIKFCRTSDGVSLAVAAVGSGRPLVKAANWLTHIEYDWESPLWSPMLHRLASHHRLIRYDARGTGLSDRTVDEISFDAFVRDLEAVLDFMELDRCAILGFSQGAAVAVEYAVRHPERVSKLILCGGYMQGRNRRGAPGEAELAQAFLSIMQHGWGDEHSAFMRAFSSIYIPGAPPEQIKWFADLQRITASAETAVRIRTACDKIDVTERLPHVRTPTLILHARYDNVAPFDQGRHAAATIPDARLVSLQSENHIPLPDDPAWRTILEEIEGFLQD